MISTHISTHMFFVFHSLNACYARHLIISWTSFRL
jgi:hypothetical protein